MIQSLNDTFALSRFLKYARKEIREHWKALFLGFVALVAGGLYEPYQVWRFLHSRFYEHTDFMIRAYTSLIIMSSFAIWIAGAYLFRIFANKQRTQAYLLLPVSTFEKYLFAWLATFPFVGGLCYVVWKVVWMISFSIIKSHFSEVTIQYHDPASEDIYASVLLLGGGGAFMLGTLALGRLGALKTLAILLLTGWLLFGLMQVGLLHAFIPQLKEVNVGAPVPWLRPDISYISANSVNNSLRSTQELTFMTWWVFVVPVALWTITYLKLKEKEV